MIDYNEKLNNEQMICPLMSIRMIVWSGSFVECQRERCMWFTYCRKYLSLSHCGADMKGRWVEVVDRTEMYDKEGVKTWGMLFQCNQCGFVLNAIEGHTGQYNFCPNCGADMRGDNHD